MNTCEIKIIAEEGVVVPSYKTSGSAGADVCAYLPDGNEFVFKPMERCLVPTGIKMAIPQGYEVQVRPRSGLAAKNGITCLNTPGTIDSDYRGEVKVILINLGSENFTIKNGERIAQLVAAPVTQSVYVKTDVLDSTKRGEGGFGSTGV